MEPVAEPHKHLLKPALWLSPLRPNPPELGQQRLILAVARRGEVEGVVLAGVLHD